VARIYVSSTYGDLREHREEVYRTLRKLGHVVVAMEDYVAADQRPLERCLADVAACDLYVGIFAHRYGYVPEHDNPKGRSITELEYRHAQAEDKPRLVFLLDPAAPWPPTWSDAFTGDGEGGGRIRALREELGRDRLASFFATSDQLAHEVSVAVTNQLRYQLVEDLPAVQARRSWTIPPPVRSFTGREEQLAALRAQLTDEGAATLVPTAALYGMGGVGKTQLALAYAQRYRQEYQLGWWVPAETELGILTALADLAVALGLPAELPPAELAAAAREALGGRSGWLLIFDNAPDPATVANSLPGGGGGHVLVTSRDPAWQGIADPVPVDLLPLDEAVELLLRRSGDLDRQAAARLAEALDRLPLALEQAAAYAASQGMPLVRYLELFEARRDELLALGRPLAYQGTVDATFTLALDQLRATDPAAGRLLELCSLLAPDEIPLALLLSDPAPLPEPLAATVADPVRQGEVVGVLYRQGLLTRDTGDTAQMHRLVQAVTLAHLPEADRHQRVVDVVELVVELFPSMPSEPDHWPRCVQLTTHAQTVIAHSLDRGLTSPALSDLLTRTGTYLRSRGLLKLAHELHEEALAMRQRLYNGDDASVAASLATLSISCYVLGAYERALELDEQALAMYQRLLKGDHPNLATIMNNVASDLYMLEGYERARDLHEQALVMRQRLYSGDHPDVAQSLSNLAFDMRKAGEFARALELDQQALEMRQRLDNGDHPNVGRCLSFVAIDLRELGEQERARQLDGQALAMFQRLYDGDHPDVASSLGSLAIDLRQAGDYRRARELDEQALGMLQRLYSGDHSHLATIMTNLATDLRETGDLGRARELDEQALAMRQRLAERRSVQ
jgi:tetratricopeptide (TPR) repeat protein